MPPLHKVSIKTGVVNALNAQSHPSIYPTGFPFTLNPTMGCSFGCKFCYSPLSLRKNFAKMNREHFFNESTIKLDIANSLDEELTRLSGLPQHLKRVQINETSDYYLVEVLKELENQDRDIMMEILETFQNQWNGGNKWMLHILTKSYLIEKHLGKLKEMKEMVQVEMSLTTPYENQLRNLELYTPTIKKRLETIEKLSKEDIFVRVMAMPFYGGVSELDDLKTITFNAGARALKNKALNYFNWNDVINISFEDLVQYKLPQAGSRKDTIISQAHMIKSGEDYLVSDIAETIDVIMPSDNAWDAMSKFEDRTTLQTLNKVEMGYDELNDVDWGYIKSKIVNLQSSIRTNIMSNSNLSSAQKFYSSYFPEILQDSPSQNEYRFNSPFVESDTNLNLVINNDGYFECKLTGMRGYYSQFHQSVEGMPISEELEYKKTIEKNILPDISLINKYSQDLLEPISPQVFNYLTQTRGLDTKTILENKIGYDHFFKELVFPILNATGAGITSVKYLSYPLDKSSKLNYVLGGTRLFNYHKIKFPVKRIETFIFTRDIIDALYLTQIGYSVLYCVSDDKEWNKEWNKLINAKKLIFINEDLEEILRFTAALDVESKRIFKIELGETISDFFIKGNKSKDDLDKMISQTRSIEEIKKNVEFIEEAKALKEETLDINPAQDFVNGKFYFGFVSNGKVNLISSTKKIIKKDQFEDKKFKLTNNDFNLCRFTLDGIKKFTVEDKRVKASELFISLKSYLKKYIYFGEEHIYDLIPLWIMGTYVYQIFNHYPYIHIQAEKGSGKTFLMSLIEPLCFNGKHSAQDTGATLFREVENNSRTLLLDELEQLSKKDSSSFQDVNSILNSGYSKGGVVSRTSGSTVKYYKTYSPKMFAGISDISDTLDSRSIKVLMKRKIKQDKLEAYRENPKISKFHQATRDDLYIFALQFAQNIHDLYSNADDKIPILQEFTGRRYDLYAPLFIISKIIDGELSNEKESITSSLFDYSEKEKDIHLALDSATSEQSKIMDSLNIILKQARYKKAEEVGGQNILYYLTDDILDIYNNLVENRRSKITKTALTQKLGKLGIPQPKEMNINGKTKKCYIINLENLEDRAKRYDIEFSTEGIIRTKSSASTKFIPNRLLITENAKDQPLTNQIINTVKQLNQNVIIEKVNSERPAYPDSLGISERYKYLSETLLLGTRSESSPFTACFESPGNIVEGMTVTTNLQFHCSSNCEFCYLHGTQSGEPRWRKIYTNLDRWEEEIKKERLVFDYANSLWSAISFYKKVTLPKIPEGFKEVVDDFRKDILKSRSSINELEDVKRELEKTLTDIFGRIGLKIDYPNDYPRVAEIKKDLRSYFRENAKLKLKLNVGEYTDIVRTNHLTGHLNFLMQRIQRDPDFNITMYIKSADIDDLVKYNGHNRVQVTLGFNTDYAITKWEKDTSSLDERLDAFNKIQKAKGFIIRPSIEPIIAYNGFIKEYQELAKRMKTELNLEATNVSKIRFGCLRIGTLLKQDLLNYFPQTTLFPETEDMFQPVKPDNKMRYSEDLRIEVYKVLLEEFAAYRSKLALACEYPSIWEKLEMNYKDHLKDYVYQYPG